MKKTPGSAENWLQKLQSSNIYNKKGFLVLSRTGQIRSNKVYQD